MTDHYLEKVYAGFLGMNIGIRLGAPVEPTIWTYERIRSTYGEITDYVKDYKHFAADDDANGPVFFIRALLDDATDREATAQDVARAWLNYAREGVGMFWWGGYGVSTEHTAYLNLKQGIPAPRSGSAKQNGMTLAEQIGGQIFIDTWGLVYPDRPEQAANAGERAASVSHDRNGLYGARFMCAAIASAFSAKNAKEVFQKGMAVIPADSTYHAVMTAVSDFHREHPEDWRACYQMLAENWGYDRYPGVCHIIPNAGVCAMALLYSEGKFDRGVEIATMAGWDTDCNAGNVGTILGVLCGAEGLPERYRKPINDGIVCSSICGSLNILDIPTFCRELAILGYRLAGEKPEEKLVQAYRPKEIYFDFELPGSTHHLFVSDPFRCRIRNSSERSFAGKRSLQILMDRMSRGEYCKIYYKPFYLREDFSDERYSPVFSPTVYPGQTMSMKLYLDQWNGSETPGVAPYIRTCSDKRERIGGYTKLVNGQWIDISWVIPDTDGDAVDEVGFLLESYTKTSEKTLAMVYLDEFTISGKAAYRVDLKKQRRNFASVTPFSMDHGAWTLEDGELKLLHLEPAFAYTGGYYAEDCEISASVTPRNGESHLLIGRALGAQRCYAAGLNGNGKLAILKNDFGFRILAEQSFEWEQDRSYQLTLRCTGERLTLLVNGEEILSAEDAGYNHGMFGCGSLCAGRTDFGDFRFQEI